MPTFWNRINTVLLLIVLFVVIGALGTHVWGGPLDPPGPPASTLPQVEPRMPIPPVGWSGTFPISIAQPGSYYLTRSLTGVSGQNGLVIGVEAVTVEHQPKYQGGDGVRE